MKIRFPHRSLEILRGPVLLLLVCSIAAVGCNRSAEEERLVPERDINSVMNDHAARLLEMDEVVMVAIGELKDKTPCIQVYVKYKSDALADKIGTHLEGHPVDYIVSDEIRPFE